MSLLVGLNFTMKVSHSKNSTCLLNMPLENIWHNLLNMLIRVLLRGLTAMPRSQRKTFIKKIGKTLLYFAKKQNYGQSTISQKQCLNSVSKK